MTFRMCSLKINFTEQNIQVVQTEVFKRNKIRSACQYIHAQARIERQEGQE